MHLEAGPELQRQLQKPESPNSATAESLHQFIVHEALRNATWGLQDFQYMLLSSSSKHEVGKEYLQPLDPNSTYTPPRPAPKVPIWLPRTFILAAKARMLHPTILTNAA